MLAVVSILAIGAAAIAALAPSRVGVTNVGGALDAPVRILDTRFGIGGPAIRLGAGQSRTLDLRNYPELDQVGPGSVVLEVSMIPRSAMSTITLYASGGSPTRISTMSGSGVTQTAIDAGSDRQFEVSVGGEPIDLIIEVVGIRQLTDEG